MISQKIIIRPRIIGSFALLFIDCKKTLNFFMVFYSKHIMDISLFSRSRNVSIKKIQNNEQIFKTMATEIIMVSPGFALYRVWDRYRNAIIK